MVCNYSVLHGPLGQFRWLYIERAVRQRRILLARKKHPFKLREHLPGSLITNSMHRRFSPSLSSFVELSRETSSSPGAELYSLFFSRSLPFFSHLCFSSLLVATSISIVDRAMTSIFLQREMRRSRCVDLTF